MEKEETKGEKLRCHGNILALPCSELKDHPLRLSFYSQWHLEALTASIRATGLLEPILVWSLGDGGYTILRGHYRVRAARRLRRSRIPCRVMECERQYRLSICIFQRLVSVYPHLGSIELRQSFKPVIGLWGW